MKTEPMTPVERATAVLLTQTLQMLHGAERRDIAIVLNRYGVDPENGLVACEWLLSWASARAESVMKENNNAE